jgi:hypothetical protein
METLRSLLFLPVEGEGGRERTGPVVEIQKTTGIGLFSGIALFEGILLFARDGRPNPFHR